MGTTMTPLELRRRINERVYQAVFALFGSEIKDFYSRGFSELAVIEFAVGHYKCLLRLIATETRGTVLWVVHDKEKNTCVTSENPLGLMRQVLVLIAVQCGIEEAHAEEVLKDFWEGMP